MELVWRYDLDYPQKGMPRGFFVDSIPPMSPQYLEDSKSEQMSNIASEGTPDL